MCCDWLTFILFFLVSTPPFLTQVSFFFSFIFFFPHKSSSPIQKLAPPSLLTNPPHPQIPQQLFSLTLPPPLKVGANAGIVGMTKEHLGLALALGVPILVVVTKIDMCPPNVLHDNLQIIHKVLLLLLMLINQPTNQLILFLMN